VFSYTVNYHQWRPGLTVPYVVALIELSDQPGLRLTSNLVDCPSGDVRIDMSVAVTFVRQGDVYVPLFRPSTVR
jgi:uncharacterized OB-fold protein